MDYPKIVELEAEIWKRLLACLAINSSEVPTGGNDVVFEIRENRQKLLYQNIHQINYLQFFFRRPKF